MRISIRTLLETVFCPHYARAGSTTTPPLDPPMMVLADNCSMLCSSNPEKDFRLSSPLTFNLIPWLWLIIVLRPISVIKIPYVFSVIELKWWCQSVNSSVRIYFLDIFPFTLDLIAWSPKKYRQPCVWNCTLNMCVHAFVYVWEVRTRLVYLSMKISFCVHVNLTIWSQLISLAVTEMDSICFVWTSHYTMFINALWMSIVGIIFEKYYD